MPATSPKGGLCICNSVTRSWEQMDLKQAFQFVSDHSIACLGAAPQEQFLTQEATPWSTVTVGVLAGTSAAGTDRPHLAASVAREQLGNVAAHVWALQRVHKALRVYANGEGCHTGEGAIVLHTLGGALKVQQIPISHQLCVGEHKRGAHGCSLRCALQRQGLNSCVEQFHPAETRPHIRHAAVPAGHEVLITHVLQEASLQRPAT